MNTDHSKLNGAHRTLTKSHNRFTADPVERLRGYRMVWGAPGGPPSDWKAGAALGNGDIGALIYGHPADFGVALGKSDLWDCVPGTKSNFRGESFEQLRQIFSARDQSAFNRLFLETEVSPKSHAIGGGTLRLHFFEQAGTHSPQLTCDLATGTSELEFYPYGMDTDLHTWGKIKVQSLVSRSAQVVAMRVMATDTCPGFAVDPTLRRNFPPEVAPIGSVTWELSRGESSSLPKAKTILRDGVVLLKQTFSNGDFVVTALAAKNCETESHAAGTRAVGVFRTVEGSAMEIFVTLVTSQDSADPVAEAERRVRAAMETGYETIHAEHTQWWSEFWNRSAIFLSDPTLERWFYVSLYYCASALEPGRQSPGLQGVWVHEEVPAWFGDYHTNVNLQAVYWGVFGANRVELAEPFLRLIQQLYPQAKRDTESYFRMKGVRFPHAASIEGYELTEADWAASLGLSVGGSGWLAMLLFDLYRYTMDRELLAKEIFPLLADVADFYADFLTWNAEHERFDLFPSVFFEALSPRLASVGTNSLYELSLVRGALHVALAAASLLDADVDRRKRWQRTLDGLADFPRNDQGAWTGFEGRDLRTTGGHQFDLPPVFPGEHVSLWHGPQKWRDAASESLLARDPQRSKTGQAWCGGQGVRELIRMGEVEMVRDAAAYTPANVPTTNALTHNWMSHFLQTEHAMGMCSVPVEMLVLQTGDVLRFLPCFPEDVAVAFHSLRAPGAFLVSGEKRQAVLDYAVIESLAGAELRLANPWSRTIARLRDAKSGREILLSDHEILVVSTTPDQILILDRPEVPCESITMREITTDDMSPVDSGAPVQLMGCQGVVSVENN
jgi:hypothetical protein